MSYMRNIKEMLNIPTGTRNVGSDENCSLTDSQVFFGSQFWHEHAKGTSQDMSLSSKNSQQSSQEGSDPSIFNRYTSKPLLFGDYRDKTRNSGMLDKFEEDRKKAKEKKDSDQFTKQIQQIGQTLINIQQLVTGTEKNTSVCHTVFKKIDSFAPSLQNRLEDLQREISQKFDTLVDKLSSQKDVMTDLEEKLQKNGETTAELAVQLKSLKSCLECLREEQQREHKMLEEALQLLNSLVPKPSEEPSPKVGIESGVQTSPELQQSVHNVLQNSPTDGMQLPSAPYNSKHLGDRSLQDNRPLSGKRRLSRNVRKFKKRPLVLSQKKYSISHENIDPLNPNKKPQIAVGTLRDPLADQQNHSPACLTPVKKESSSDQANRWVIKPLTFSSQDSPSSECGGIEPILERLGSESKMGTPMKHGGLWQLFELDFE